MLINYNSYKSHFQRVLIIWKLDVAKQLIRITDGSKMAIMRVLNDKERTKNQIFQNIAIDSGVTNFNLIHWYLMEIYKSFYFWKTIMTTIFFWRKNQRNSNKIMKIIPEEAQIFY